MVDIQIALFIMSSICCALLLLSNFLYRKLSTAGKAIFSIGVIALIVLDLFVFSDSIVWAQILPFKAIIVYSNILIPLNGLLCGIIWANKKLYILRRLISITLLLLLAYLPTIEQIHFKQMEFHNIWKDDICIQSRQTSCVPAAAATLLKYYGVETNEAEMAQLCLTRPDGTSLFGLFRALRIQTQNSPYQTTIGKANLEQLKDNMHLPVILIVYLDKQTDKSDPRYSENWGWSVDVMHSIVMFEFLDNDKVEIGDPSVGLEIWSIQALKDLWHGEYITIEENSI